MKRRKFLILGSLLGVPSWGVSRAISPFNMEITELIGAVQEHLFPEGSQVPSAKSMDAIGYLVKAITHKSYNKEQRNHLVVGAQKLAKQTEKKFMLLSSHEKENVLRRYAMSKEGHDWLQQILFLTMEALFSDPLYGSNIQASGWKALHTQGGSPRPKKRYIYESI